MQPASVAVIIAEGWHTVKGQQAPYQCGIVSLVYLSSCSRRMLDGDTQGQMYSATAVSARRQTPESVTKRCFSLAGAPVDGYNIAIINAP